MGWLELCAVQWGEVHSPTSGEEWPQNDQYRQDTVWKAAFQKRMLEFSVLSRSMNLQYVLVVKKKLMVFGHALRSVLPAGRGKWSFPYDQDWWTTPEVLFAMYINSWRESSKKRQAGSFQWCPVTGPEAIPKAGDSVQSQSCLNSRFELQGLQRSPPTSATPWLYGWFYHAYLFDIVL